MKWNKWLAELYSYADEGYASLFILPDQSTMFRDVGDRPDAVFPEQMAAELGDKDVYYSVCLFGDKPARGRGKMTDVSYVPGFWLDIDVRTGEHKQAAELFASKDEALAWVLGLPTPPSYTFDSGGGLHCYWKLNEGWLLADERERRQAQVASRDFQAALRMLARDDFGYWVDNTSDLARVLRMPGSVNQKYGAEVVMLDAGGAEYGLWDFAWMRDVRIDPTKLQAPQSDDLSPKLAGRNDRMKSVVSAMFYRGASLNAMLDEVLAVDARNDVRLFNDPSESSVYVSSDPRVNALTFITNIVASITRGLDERGELSPFMTAATSLTQAEAPKIRVADFAELLLDDSDPEPDLIDGLLGTRELMVIAGPPKSQKSMLAMEMCMQVAAGKSWRGYSPLRPLRILYLNAELKLDKIRGSRLRELNLEPETIEAMRDNFVVTDRFAGKLDQPMREQLESIMDQRWGEDLVDILVIDPLQNVYDGEENASDSMNEWLTMVLGWMERVNPSAAVVLVHHANKVNASDMALDPFNAIRGSSALRGRYDACLFLYRKEIASEVRVLNVDLRYALAPRPVDLLYNEGEFIEVSADQASQFWFDSMGTETEVLLEAIRTLGPSADTQQSRLANAYADYLKMDPKLVANLLTMMVGRGYVEFVPFEGMRGNSKGALVIAQGAE